MESKKVIVIGASGHGKVIADIVRASGDEFFGFLDDDISKKTLGIVSDWEKHLDCYFVIGIGNAEVRERLSKLPLKWYTAVHPTAVISPSAKIGNGTVVMPSAVINASAIIGKHCIVNTSAVVEHDNSIGDYSHISVGTKLGGTVEVGKRCWIGIGSVVKNNTNICDDVTIGAGAVVVKNIIESGTYVGVPAKRL